jgi:hypothetical protein
MKVLALLLFGMFCGVLRAEQLLWPLPGHQTITGGFADSRPDHFHGGVDVSTQRECLPVVAPADGWIERIAVTPLGYGRTLHFRLPDGRTAVFAHLSRFEPGLEKMLRDSEMVVGTYRVDCSFDQPSKERQFRRGDTIAYSGDTGVGPPHFHFEMREGAVQTDPLANFDPIDNDPPVIVSVAWTPLSKFTPAGSGSKLALKKSGAHEWTTSAIRSDEPVAFFIRTYDPGPWGRKAVPSAIRVKVNGVPMYEDQGARVDLLGPRLIYAKLVWTAVQRDHVDARRMFAVPPPAEYVDSTRDCAGWIASETDVAVQIEVSDRAGNVSTVNLRVSAGNWPKSPSQPLQSKISVGAFTLSMGAIPAESWAQVDERLDNEIHIGPTGLAFADRLKLTYSAPNVGRGGWFFYERFANGRIKPYWTLNGNSPDSISCFVLRAGTYGIARDNQPPDLKLSVKSGQLVFRLSDGMSGVDDGTIRCKVDGQPAIAQFEYEQRGGTIWTMLPLERGSHAVELTAGDRAGNVQTWHETVAVR